MAQTINFALVGPFVFEKGYCYPQLKKFNCRPHSIGTLRGKSLAWSRLEETFRPSFQCRADNGNQGQFQNKTQPENEEGKAISNQENGNFEARLVAIRQEAEAKKERQAEKDISATLNYDEVQESTESNGKDNFLKFGGAIIAVLLTVLFIAGDLIPQTNSSKREANQLSAKEKKALELQVERFESMAQQNPEDLDSLEGLAVSFAQLGEYEKASEKLDELIQKSPQNIEAVRLLAEVYYLEEKYDESADKYRLAIQMESEPSVSLLQGLVDTLVAAQKPDKAVEEALLGRSKAQSSDITDKLPFDLLLARAYSGNRQPEAASAVYDQLIAEKKEDFRPYVAKAVLLKSIGKINEAANIFRQARFLAPEASKAIVDDIAKS